jgi:hypothetical protein
LGRSVHTGKRRNFGNGSKEIGLEVNADKTKYMVMSGDQKSRRSHRIKPGNSSLESLEQFRFLVTTVTKKEFCAGRNLAQIEVRDYLLSFDAESFVFQFSVLK